MTGPASNAMSINKVTLDNACTPGSDTMSIDNASAPASNATPINKAIIDKSGTGVANETQSKVRDGLQFANQELEEESFLCGITNEVKWQELISKWVAFEKDYPIKGVIFSFL